MNAFCLAMIAVVVFSPSRVSAQKPDPGSFASDVAMRVILDPTTYAPAFIGWTATRLDWESSQVFFHNGFVEDNPRFTVSGHRGDIPISYGAGNRKILGDAIANLQVSVINNVTSQIIERVLIRQNPNHRKLIRAIG